MKRVLIMHPYLATYRVDVYNRFNQNYNLEVLLYGSKKEKSELGFNLSRIYKIAEFKHTTKDTGWYIGRHLISTIFYKTIKRFKPNIIIAHELGINTIVAIILKLFFKYKIFVTVDDNPQMAKYEYGFLRSLLRNFVVNNIDGYICVNPFTQKYLQNKYSKKTCRFIYFPIIQNDILLSKKINESRFKAFEYIEKYNLKNKKILLYVGRFEYVKRIDHIITAYSKAIQDNTILVLVGSGSLLNEMQDLSKNLGLNSNIIYTGNLSGESLYAWYYLAHLFVLASNHEAFGAVVNEALVGGCRCIVSNHCGSYTLISNKNGVVFESENIDDLTLCLKKEFDKIDIDKKHLSLMPKSFNDYYSELESAINQ